MEIRPEVSSQTAFNTVDSTMQSKNTSNVTKICVAKFLEQNFNEDLLLLQFLKIKFLYNNVILIDRYSPPPSSDKKNVKK